MGKLGMDELQLWAIENPGYFWDLLSLHYQFRAEDILRFREYIHFGSLKAHDFVSGQEPQFSPGLLYNPNIHWEDPKLRTILEGLVPDFKNDQALPITSNALCRVMEDMLEKQLLLDTTQWWAQSPAGRKQHEELAEGALELQKNFQQQLQYLNSLFCERKFGVMENVQELNEILDEITDTRMYLFLNPWIWRKLFYKRVNYFFIENVFAHFEERTGVYNPLGLDFD